MIDLLVISKAGGPMVDLISENIENSIYLIRGHRVILDNELAKLYEVETKALNRQVKRNIKRFPPDFMFQLSNQELANLKYQIGTSSSTHGGRRKLPLAFTENGVAMLSGILNSDRAIEVNIAIMRIFTKLISFLLLERELSQRMENLEKGTVKLFKTVFERMDNLEENLTPNLTPNRKKIGLK